MRGYLTSYGYMGLMPDDTWVLFATESEYREAYAEFVEP